jgi:SAM-dependent methyltransferase
MITDKIQDTAEQKIKAYWTKNRLKNLLGAKSWLLKPDGDWQLLQTIGLMSPDGAINHDQLRKLSQINHMVQLLRPSLEDLRQRHPVVHIADAACGTSALSLALAWLFKHRWNHQAKIVGVDQNPKVIATSEKRAVAAGLSGETAWMVSTLGELQSSQLFGEERPHLVISLHACDKATDQALWYGLQSKADVIAVAPCCHRELAAYWKANVPKWPDHPLRVVMNNPQLRHETASHLTDALRVAQVRSLGYEVTTTEFVPSEHTPKNRLILCQRRGLYHKPSQQEFADLKGVLGNPVLELERLSSGNTPSENLCSVGELC